MHMFYEDWPDFGCPKEPQDVLNLIVDMRTHLPHTDRGPIVVHCRSVTLICPVYWINCEIARPCCLIK